MSVVSKQSIACKLVRLGDVCEIVPGRHISEDNHNRGARGVPYITGPSDFGIIHAKASRWTEKPDVMCQPKDILVTVKGAGVAKINFAPSEATCIGRQIMAVRASPAFINLVFLYFALLWSQERLKAKASGATVPGLSIEDLEGLCIPLPPLDEQALISAELQEQVDTIEKTSVAIHEQIQAASLLRASILREAYDNPRNHGKKFLLGQICEIQLGKMLSPKSKQGLRPVPYLRNQNIQWNRLDLRDVATMDFSEVEEVKFSLRSGDLLVCEGGEPGRATIWNGELDRCCYQKALHRIRPLNNLVDPTFLLFRLWHGHFTGEFVDSNAKTTIAHLPAVRLKQIEVDLPDIRTQASIGEAISEEFRRVDDLIKNLAARLNSLDIMRSALFNSIFQETNHHAQAK